MNLRHRILTLLLCVPIVQVGAGVVVTHHCCGLEAHHVHMDGEVACASTCEAGHNPVGCCQSAGARVLLYKGEVLRTAFDRFVSPVFTPCLPFSFSVREPVRVEKFVRYATDAVRRFETGDWLALLCVFRL
ncbi:MAG: hypothetical protein IJZ92_02890 [Bacteroidaceae bacterium]|nr:hypothetical protein [Bacteroidaceae bacterium]